MTSTKHSVSVLLAIAFVFFITFDSHSACAASQPFVNFQTTQSSYAPSQSPELAEASELIAKVVKLYAQGKFQEALPMAKRALQLREKTLDANDQLVRNAQINLAEVYIALRKYGDAESPIERAVKSYRTANPDDVRLAALLERRAMVKYALGDNSGAQSSYEESLRIKEKAFGVDSAKTGASLLQLGEFHQFAGSDEKAATYYKRLIEVRAKASGPEANEQLREAIARYVCLLRKLKKDDEADQLQARLESLPLSDLRATGAGYQLE